MLSTVGARGSLEASQEADNFEKYQVDRAGLHRHRDAFNLNESELCEMLLNWILDHEDEVNQSERWRTQNQKKNAKRFDKIDKGVNALTMAMKDLKRTLPTGNLQDEVTELKKMVKELHDKLASKQEEA